MKIPRLPPFLKGEREAQVNHRYHNIMGKINLSSLSFFDSEFLYSERLTSSETNCVRHSNGLFGLRYIVTTDDMGPV